MLLHNRGVVSVLFILDELLNWLCWKQNKQKNTFSYKSPKATSEVGDNAQVSDGRLMALSHLQVVDKIMCPCPFHTCFKFIVCFPLTGEALTQSSLLEADGDSMTTAVEPMNLHHAMLRSPSRCLHLYVGESPTHTVWKKDIGPCSNPCWKL